MRKTALALAALFALAIGASALLDTAKAAGLGRCTYKCICSVPHRCCTVNGITSCKPDPTSPLQCPQVAC
jgi:hypothetical protein